MRKKTTRYRNNPRARNRENRQFVLRLSLVTIILAVLFVAVMAKLVILQVVDHAYYAAKARKAVDSRREVPARRGTIFDRRGRVIAEDVLYYDVALDGTVLQEKEKTIRKLSRLLGVSEQTIKRRLRKNPRFAKVKWQVTVEVAEQIRRWENPGVILERRFNRAYPFNENGAQVIGFCNVDNQPMGGIELQYNQYLQGKPGWKMYLRNARGEQLPNPDVPGEEPIDGFDVVLTLDMEFQTILEDELKSGAEKYRAKEAEAILLDPHTGEVLAMANYPQFDPNHYRRYPLSVMRNRAISDLFEPGSTFKLVLLTAALENLHLDLDRDIVFCENGKYRLLGRTVWDHKPYGWLTFRKVIENSSNIGCMKIADRLQREVLYRYARNFGFGMITGIDLPGESPGKLHPLKRFSRISHYFLSIGYEVGTTPLQLINAYAAVANGGKLLRPFVLKEVLGSQREPLYANQPEVIRQVISRETARLVTQTLTGVVNHGTGRFAALPALTIAGKTGTAQVYDPEKKDYDNRRHVASFVGFFPAEAPQYVLLVVVKEPRGEYYGGRVAAPIFKNIARRLISLESVPLENFVRDEEETTGETVAEDFPELENFPLELARQILRNRGIEMELVGEGNRVRSQKIVREDDKVVKVCLYLEEEKESTAKVMPRLKGLSLKEALSVLAQYRLSPTVEGYGVVVRQVPRAGVRIKAHQPVKLVCKPS